MQSVPQALPNPLRTRIAPTPSGLLHAGNVLNFLLVQMLAKKFNGRVRLRIDDLDALRVKDEYLRDIFEKISVLGITIDDGPSDLNDHCSHYSQSDRIPQYQQAIDVLAGKGMLFACTCSRASIRNKNRDGFYLGTCADRRLPLDTPGSCLRLRSRGQVVTIPEWGGQAMEVDLSTNMPYPVIMRKDGLPSYQIASLIDDLEHGINFIVRGKDLLPSTAIQLHLAELLERPEFHEVVFVHHDLEVDDDGEKLSKSSGASSGMSGYLIADLRRKAQVIVEGLSE